MRTHILDINNFYLKYFEAIDQSQSVGSQALLEKSKAALCWSGKVYPRSTGKYPPSRKGNEDLDVEMWDWLAKNEKGTNTNPASQTCAVASRPGARVLTAGAGQKGDTGRWITKFTARLQHCPASSWLVAQIRFPSFSCMQPECSSRALRIPRAERGSGQTVVSRAPTLVSPRLCWWRSVPEQDTHLPRTGSSICGGIYHRKVGKGEQGWAREAASGWMGLQGTDHGRPSVGSLRNKRTPSGFMAWPSLLSTTSKSTSEWWTITLSRKGKLSQKAGEERKLSSSRMGNRTYQDSWVCAQGCTLFVQFYYIYAHALIYVWISI